MPRDSTPIDTLNRPLRDLRISVTDRCNFRCTYCMPRSVYGRDYEFLPRSELLSFEELVRVVTATTSLGVAKVRITGGEPLLRAGIDRLVAMLNEIDTVADLTMTTNGSLLPRFAERLAAAGLDRISVSLDAVDDATFRSMNDADVGVAEVLTGIEAAAEAGLGPIKVNAVVQRNVNDHQIVDMARHFRGTGHIVRFIEYMDVGTTNGWRLDDVVSADEMLARIDAVFPLEAIDAGYRGEVARRYRYRDGMGEIGVITSVTRALLRSEADDDELTAAISAIWERRDDRYSETRSDDTSGWERIEMSYIGG
jgi:cyclic pyranopterin phosphate synthase